MIIYLVVVLFFFFFQAEDGIRDTSVTGVQTCALPISVAAVVQEIVPEASIVVAHGQQPADELEEAMTQFVRKDADILVATTIIESGRSEERRVGKECRWRGGAEAGRKRETDGEVGVDV